MDEATNAAIREHEIRTDEWAFSKLSEQLYLWFDRFNKEFFDGELQPAAISFHQRRINNLGHYVLGRNAFGLKWNINLNRLHAGRSLVTDLATLLHEMIHQYHEEAEIKASGNYHTVRFRARAKLLAIPCNQNGLSSLDYHDPFLSLLREYSIDVSEIQENRCPQAVIKARRGPGSKLKKWSCGCTNARVAIDDFQAKCLKCGNIFKLSEKYG